MAINFPNNPTVNDTHTVGDTTWTWDGTTWLSSASSYVLPTATTTTLGGVKVDGTTVTISNGTISSPESYTLPTATTTTLGGVKVDGTTVTISNGTISSVASGDVNKAASSTDNAIVRFDGTSGDTLKNSLVTVSDTGQITAPAVGNVIPFYYASTGNFPTSDSTNHGAIAHSHADESMFFSHGGNWVEIANKSDLIGSAQKTYTAQGDVSVGDIVKLNTDGTISSTKPTILANPDIDNTPSGDYFGYAVASCDSYIIVGAMQENNSQGAVYIYNANTKELLHSIPNPNGYSSTTSNDSFGCSVAICEQYAIVGAYQEDSINYTGVGWAYIFDTVTGNLLHSIENPSNNYANGNFGWSVAITESYAIIGARNQWVSGYNGTGKAFIYDPATGNLLHTIDNPIDEDSSNFGQSVAINEQFAIVGAWAAYATYNDLGKVYVFDPATGNLLQSIPNPRTAFNNTTFAGSFGSSVSISGNYAAIGNFDDEFGRGSVYIYDTSTWNVLHTIPNNGTGSFANQYFGHSVSTSDQYTIVGSYGVNSDAGKIFIYDNATGNLLFEQLNPNYSGSNVGDRFGYSVAITDSFAVVGAYLEDNGGVSFVYDKPSFTGIAAESIADGSSGLIDLAGAINRNQTGLTLDLNYYLDWNGTLTTNNSNDKKFVGKALSPTDLQIFSNYTELSKLIDIDFTTNSPTTTNGLVLTTDGDNTYSFKAAVTNLASLNDVDIVTNSPATTSGLALLSDGNSGYGFGTFTPTLARNTVSVTTASLADGNSSTHTLTGFKSYYLLKLTTNAAAWVILYTDTASRTSDYYRDILTDPSPGSGVLAEAVTLSADTVKFTPGVLCWNNDTVPSTNIYARIYNRSGVTQAITVTLTIVQVES